MKPEENTLKIPHDILKNFIKDVFISLGVRSDDAQICASVLITADIRGIDSHGIGRLKPIYYDRIKKFGIQKAVSEIKTVRDFGATAVIDGGHGMGMVISQKCMKLAMEKASKFGVGVVTARNSTHYGFAAYYPLMAADKGMIGMTTTNARPSIAPTFGVEPMLGTNPLVFAFPTDEEFHFTNDYATSITQRGKIEQYERLGKEMPPGWVIDSSGKTKTDPGEVLKDLVSGEAALTPIGGIGEESGGYKGYGFAAVAEVLSSALQQGAFLKALSGFDENGKRIPYSLGHFFMAVNIEAFTETDKFRKTTGDIMRSLRNSKKAPGANRIYTAGEKEHIASIDRKKSGIPIPESLKKEIILMREECGLENYDFGF
ncbi:MAG: Ldh family oxidoreductase [Fibrobacterota bacterium]